MFSGNSNYFILSILALVIVERQWHRLESTVLFRVIQLFIFQPTPSTSHSEFTGNKIANEKQCCKDSILFYLKKFHTPRRIISKLATTVIRVSLCRKVKLRSNTVWSQASLSTTFNAYTEYRNRVSILLSRTYQYKFLATNHGYIVNIFMWN